MPRLITKKLRENMSSFKTKTIALIASSLIVAVAGLSFATTPAEANTTKKASVAPKSTQTNKPGRWYPNIAKKPSSAPKAAKPNFVNGGVPNNRTSK